MHSEKTHSTVPSICLQLTQFGADVEWPIVSLFNIVITSILPGIGLAALLALAIYTYIIPPLGRLIGLLYNDP